MWPKDSRRERKSVKGGREKMGFLVKWQKIVVAPLPILHVPCRKRKFHFGMAHF